VEGPPLPERCGPSLLGKGTIRAEIEFPEAEPVEVKSALLAFNQGIRDGRTTIMVYAHLGPPVSGSIVATVKVSKENKGRFGTKWAFAIPKIAGGYGSITEFNLTIHREFAYKEKRRSYLLAKCPDGHLNAHATSVFSDGSEQADQFVRACTPTG
jgi:hypothetical protein